MCVQCVVVKKFFDLKFFNQFDFSFSMSQIMLMNLGQRKITRK